MATIRHFEEITAWQKARELGRAVYEASRKGAFARDFALRNQIRRAAISIMYNIAEGFERSGTSEFSHFLSVAKGSAGELEAQLFIGLDQGYLTEKEFAALRGLVREVGSLVGGFMRYLREAPIRGTKFKKVDGGRNSKLGTRNY